MEKLHLLEMTWEEAERKLKESDIVILPVGSIEQHGPHLPLGTDSMITDEIAKKVGSKLLERGIKVVLAPPLFFGCSDEHIEYAGTISLKPETLIDVLYDICKSLVIHGAKKILIFCGHGGNFAVLDIVSRKIGTDYGIFVFYTFPFSKKATESLISEEQLGGAHADELETSMMLAIHPDLVNIDKAVKEMPAKIVKIKKYIKLGPVAEPDISFGWFRLKRTLTQKGIIGDPTLASSKKGEKIIEKSIEAFVESIVELIKMT